MKLNLLEDKWFFTPANRAESEAFQRWAISQGMSWSDNKPLSTIHPGDSIGGNHSRKGRLGHASPEWYEDKGAVRLFPAFESELSVVSVPLPEVESPQQAKIRELEETIAKAQEQIQALRKES